MIHKSDKKILCTILILVFMIISFTQVIFATSENTKILITTKWIGPKEKESVIELFSNDKQIDEVTLNASNNWTYVFENLPKYDKNKKINYTIRQEEIKGYESEIIGNMDEGYEVVNVVIDMKNPPTADNIYKDLKFPLMLVCICSLILLFRYIVNNISF